MTLRTLALGGVAWNTMVYLDAFPEPRAQTIFAHRSHTTVGSSGAGKALNFASLGCEARLWGLIGDDEDGTRIRNYLREHGVDFVAETDPAGTMSHVNLMEAAGERISIFANPGSDLHEVELETVRPLARRADVVSLMIANYCRQFIPLLQELGKPIWVDLQDFDGINTHHREFYEAADFLFMSSHDHPEWREFLEEGVGSGATVGVATHGEAGASGLSADRGWIDIPAVAAEEVVDTNGAGDAFFAGFAVEWMANPDLEAAMRAGAMHAAKAVASTELAPEVSD